MNEPESNPAVSECGAAQPCSCRGGDAFALEAAKAAVNTLVRENERLRDRVAKAENDSCLLHLEVGMMEQDIQTIRDLIAKGGTVADILKFLDTPEA